MNINEKLVYTNEKNQSVELSLTSDYILEGFEGRNGLKNTIVTSKGVNQLGQTFINNSIEMRDIDLTGKIFTAGADEALVRVFNPLLAGTLTYINTTSGISRSIEVRVEKCLVNVKSKIKQFTINLTATYPYWKADETIKELALLISNLDFPMSIPAEGIEYGTITKSHIFIENEGDVETPLLIEWIGVVENPIITNVTTGEYIKVNTSLLEGEKLLIYTHYGNKRVLKVAADGTVTNAFHLIDLTSKFFNLAIGSNDIIYDADSGADECTLFLHFNKQYIGV